MRNLFVLLLFILCNPMMGDEIGFSVFIDGRQVIFTMINIDEKTAYLGGGGFAFPSVNQYTEGIFVVPAEVDVNNIGKVTIIEIGPSAFYNCDKITSIVLPETITCIRANAFGGCSSLEKINIPANVKLIEGMAFAQCKSLKEIVLNDNLEEISTYVFTNSPLLEKINLPNSLKKIGHAGFDTFKEIYSDILDPASVIIDDYTFYGCSRTILYVPVGTKNLYKNLPNWNKFRDIIEIGSSTTITGVFEENNNLDFYNLNGYKCYPKSSKKLLINDI